MTSIEFAFEVHGLNHIKNQLLNILKELKSETLKDNIEYATLLNYQSGEILGRRLAGKYGEIKVQEHFDLMEKDKQYVHIHTHPDSSSFSPPDIKHLLDYHQLKNVIVIGKNGDLHLMGKIGVTNFHDSSRMAALFKKQLIEEIENKELDQIIQKINPWLHKFWTMNSSSFNLKYSTLRGVI
ncbi:hypothetical protein QNH39_18550 [Neobacillus novalis]|uniref:JAB domain-containing protein n=1 Tax=Neobacillus novalis TaxID=220687 RepID=A0AA95MLY7_9BACI|nr:hypothetical protein [Neobacillus novalis]WHY84639.1 hypothetical protein QNH39_18550 [Neobacillus novalis]